MKLLAFHKWHSNGRIEDKILFKKFSKNLKKVIKDHYRLRESRLASSGDLGHFYRFINRKLSTHNPIQELEKQDDTFTSDPDEMANIFNTYLQCIHNRRWLVHTISPCTNKKIMQITFTPDRTYQTLRSLRPSLSYGPDGITNNLLRNCAAGLCLPLCHIFNFSFNMNELPHDWRSAHVTPIHKKGATSDPSNYRPILLTSS